MKEPEKLTPYEKAGRIEVLNQEETETHYIDTIRTYGGATVVIRIPKHTSEENKALKCQLTRALTRFVYPDIDLDTVEYMKIIL
ncbi:MAG: hypothetical protein NC320_12525 [Clostridium sp.]|nr:hypothetical protein [Clostridium sp.]